LTPWAEALPVVLVATAVMVLPGLPVALALGLRRTALGVVPLLSAGITAVVSAVTPALGLSWRWWLPLVGAAVLTPVAAVLGRWVSRDPRAWRLPDPALLVLLAAVAAAVAGLLTAVGIARGIGTADVVGQSPDGIYHLNQVRRMLETGDASPWWFGQLRNPDAGMGFYPSLWHAFVVSTASATGATTVVATNAVSVVMGAVLWPLGALLLVRQLLGRDGVALAAGAAAAVSFAAFPSEFLTWGIVYPNVLGYALLPSALAVGVDLLGLAEHRVLGRRAGLLVAAVAAPALLLAHPNTVFALGLLLLPPIAGLLVAWSRTTWGLGRRRPVLLLAAGLVALLVLTLAVITSKRFAGVFGFDWPAVLTVPHAFGEVVLNGLEPPQGQILLSLVVIAGALTAIRGRLWWLAVDWVLLVVLYTLAAGSDSRLSNLLTGFWYNDRHRLMALIPVVGVPLVALAVSTAVRPLARRLSGSGRVSSTAVTAATTVVVLVVGWLATSGLYAQARVDTVRRVYTMVDDQDRSPMLTASERDFFSRIGTWVPEGEAVAGNPWTGSALIYGLGGRPVVFPTLSPPADGAQRIVARHLRDVADDPRVCPALEELGATYAVESGQVEFPEDEDNFVYPGLTDLRGVDGLELVASSGPTRLYRVTACD
jgi:hypothetical protein